jgi:hypothetical protein
VRRKSFPIIKETFGSTVRLKDDLRTLLALFEECTVSLLLCDDQDSKIRFLSNILSTENNGDRVIIYIDIDTAFTVFLEDQRDLHYSENLRIFRPRQGEMDDVIAGICSLSGVKIGIVVLDSVTSFYNLQVKGQDGSKMNRQLGLYLALLTTAVSRDGGKVLLTSMMRSRKMGDNSWYRTHAGGKLLRQRSELILRLGREGSGRVEVVVLKCHDPSLHGVRLQLDREDVQRERYSYQD